MFTPFSADPIIPSLTFTKAELTYVLSVLMADIPVNDNNTRLELVEIRYYLNRIKETIAKAVSDGTIERAMAISIAGFQKDVSPKSKISHLPSMSELRAKFPTLTDEEIQETIEKANEDSRKEEELRETPSPLPPMPSFIARTKDDEKPKPPPRPITKQEVNNRENAIKFSTMLGQM